MSVQRGQKLNSLQHLLPEGMVASSAWMRDHGYSSALCSKYVANGWLKQPARGVYARPGATTKWQHLVISLQSLMHQPVMVGGLSALELQRYGHYVRMGSEQNVFLYSETQLAKWVNEIDPHVRFEHRSANKLFEEAFIAEAVQALPSLGLDALDPPSDGSRSVAGGLTHYIWGEREWLMVISTPERAILEFLDELPDKQSFQHGSDLFSGLSNLSPRRLQKLLQQCKSVKVKRLFMWFADQHQHAWLKHLDPSEINLGSGKRVIAKGGRLDQKYQITVPEALDVH